FCPAPSDFIPNGTTPSYGGSSTPTSGPASCSRAGVHDALTDGRTNCSHRTLGDRGPFATTSSKNFLILGRHTPSEYSSSIVSRAAPPRTRYASGSFSTSIACLAIPSASKKPYSSPFRPCVMYSLVQAWSLATTTQAQPIA